MDGHGQTATESVPVAAFDERVRNGVSAQDPLHIDQDHPFPRGPSYDAAGLQSWNPYLGSNFVNNSASGYGSEQSYTLDVWAHAPSLYAGTSPGVTAGDVGWSSPGLRDYQYRSTGDREENNHHPQGTTDPLKTKFQPGGIMQHPGDYRFSSYESQRLLPGQQNQYQDSVPVTVAPDALSFHHARSDHEHNRHHHHRKGSEGFGRFEQQPEAPQQQQLPEPRTRKSRTKSIAGTKRDATADDHAFQPVEGATKRQLRGRKSQQQTFEKPATTTNDAWSPPTPLTISTSHSSTSSASLRGSSACSSPALYKKASLLSIADGGFRPESFDGRRPPGLTDYTNGGGDRDVYNMMSPAQTVTVSLGPSASPTTEPSDLLATPIAYAHPAGSSFSSVSTTASIVGKRQPAHPNSLSSQRQGPASSYTTSSQPTSQPARRPGRPRGSTRNPAADAAAAPPPHTGKQSNTSSSRRLSQPEAKARNRLAATKCRLKSKAMVEQLAALEAEGSETNRSLHATAAALRDQVYELHNMLLQHVDCGCELIQAYLVKRARMLAAEAAGLEGDVAGEEGRGGVGARGGSGGQWVSGGLRSEEGAESYGSEEEEDDYEE